MKERLIVLQNSELCDHVHWLDVWGLAETMQIIIDSYEEPPLTYSKTVLYLPKRWSAWWKL